LYSRNSMLNYFCTTLTIFGYLFFQFPTGRCRYLHEKRNTTDSNSSHLPLTLSFPELCPPLSDISSTRREWLCCKADHRLSLL